MKVLGFRQRNYMVRIIFLKCWNNYCKQKIFWDEGQNQIRYVVIIIFQVEEGDGDLDQSSSLEGGKKLGFDWILSGRVCVF